MTVFLLQDPLEEREAPQDLSQSSHGAATKVQRDQQLPQVDGGHDEEQEAMDQQEDDSPGSKGAKRLPPVVVVSKTRATGIHMGVTPDLDDDANTEAVVHVAAALSRQEPPTKKGAIVWAVPPEERSKALKAAGMDPDSIPDPYGRDVKVPNGYVEVLGHPRCGPGQR